MSLSIVIISGLSKPLTGIDHYLRNSLFDRSILSSSSDACCADNEEGEDISDLCFALNGSCTPLLRPGRAAIPNLTTATIESILRQNHSEFTSIPLEQIWNKVLPPVKSCDVVCLSTTFICNHRTLSFVLRRIEEAFHGAIIILGGQYSSLKYTRILNTFSSVKYIVTGDAEDTLPRLLAAVGDNKPIDGIPNIAFRDRHGAIRHSGIFNIDLDTYPSPVFEGEWPILPYESMRGCPFSCRYCAFPHASTVWRYKNAAKIAGDWERYTAANNVKHMKALDSTFTIPSSRLSDLLNILPRLAKAGLTWEGYSRANNISDLNVVESLESAGCSELSIGFESMSDTVLGYMDKKVTAAENRRAGRLLENSGIRLRVCIMVGYPGETEDEYKHTHSYLVNEFQHRCMLSPFSFIDESMPVWQDFQKFQVQINADEPHSGWKHCGMDIGTARRLLDHTLDELRWKNERGVMLLWQMDYDLPLAPHLDNRLNLRIEKLIERLAFLSLDFPDDEVRKDRRRTIMEELHRFGIYTVPDSEKDRSRLNEVNSIWIDYI